MIVTFVFHGSLQGHSVRKHQPKLIDGAHYVAEQGGAYCLLHEIAFAQKALPKAAAEPLQLWKLRVHAGQSATLTCENGDGIVVFENAIEFTAFPLNDIAFYFVHKTILVPSEY